jgi:hypothetical protein
MPPWGAGSLAQKAEACIFALTEQLFIHQTPWYPSPGQCGMRSIFTSFNLQDSQSATDFPQLRQYCICTDLAKQRPNSQERVIIFAEDRKLFLSSAANNLEPTPQTGRLIANNRLPTACCSGRSQDGPVAQQADDEIRQAEKQESAGGWATVDCGKAAMETAEVGTAFGDGPSRVFTSMTSEGRREWNKDNDEHCLYGNF